MDVLSPATNSPKLIIAAVPIGNLDDISIRNLEALAHNELIICEDTRVTSQLLYLLADKHTHLDLAAFNKKFISYRDQNHDQIAVEIFHALAKHGVGVLVTDSGTPAISDPGYKLLRYLIENHVQITHLPGPSAAIAGLILSGLPTDRFTFIGFAPRSYSKLKRELEPYLRLPSSIVLFESKHRITKLLSNLEQLVPDRQIAAVKEITKTHESVYRGTAAEIRSQLSSNSLKGEWVVVIAKQDFSRES